jgi:hypothetical protein
MHCNRSLVLHAITQTVAAAERGAHYLLNQVSQVPSNPIVRFVREQFTRRGDG